MRQIPKTCILPIGQQEPHSWVVKTVAVNVERSPEFIPLQTVKNSNDDLV